MIAELTIPFETSFTEAADRKRAKYEDLQKEARQAGYKATLITLEVGSRGVINNPGFQLLRQELKIKERGFVKLLLPIITETIKQSYKIWCQRNHTPM